MRIKSLQRFWALVCGPYFLSCTTVTFPKADFDAAPIHHPIRLVEPYEEEMKQNHDAIHFLLRGHYSNGEEETLTTDADIFRWAVPGSQAGLELEAGRATYSMVLGFSKADVGSRQFSQAHFGLGGNLIIGHIGGRIDGTLHFSDTYHNETHYAASYVDLFGLDEYAQQDSVDSPSEIVSGRKRHIDYSTTLTLNTLTKESPLNFYCSLTLGSKTFLEGSDVNFEEPFNLGRDYTSISFGAYKKLGNWGRFIGGLRTTRFLPEGIEGNVAAGKQYNIKELFVQHDIFISKY